MNYRYYEFAIGDHLYEVRWGRRRNKFGNWQRYEEVYRLYEEPWGYHHGGNIRHEWKGDPPTTCLIEALHFETALVIYLRNGTKYVTNIEAKHHNMWSRAWAHARQLFGNEVQGVDVMKQEVK